MTDHDLFHEDPAVIKPTVCMPVHGQFKGIHSTRSDLHPRRISHTFKTLGQVVVADLNGKQKGVLQPT